MEMGKDHDESNFTATRTLCDGIAAGIRRPSELALAGTSGGIAGIVTDAKTGAPIPGVRLQISSPSQSVTATTDAHGRYIVFALQPDDYTVSAEKDGYDGRAISDDAVFADQTQQYDLKLTPASEESSSGGATH